MKALSLFANVGIAEACLKEIGVDVVVANEFVEKRAQLYQKIYPDTKMVCGDITDNGVFEQIRAACEKTGVDVLMATPPCQGMSTAGKQKDFDPRNDLFFYVMSKTKRKF